MVEDGKVQAVIGLTADPMASAVVGTIIRREQQAAGVPEATTRAVEEVLRMAATALAQGIPSPEERAAAPVVPDRPGLLAPDGHRLV